MIQAFFRNESKINVTPIYILFNVYVLYSEYQAPHEPESLTVVRPVATESTAQAKTDGEEMMKLIWKKNKNNNNYWFDSYKFDNGEFHFLFFSKL